jgi:antitoxin (DNA-binding transcriptional repressor) of toxin-antitoxin stability system
MKAGILDLRRRMAEVLRALDRNEPVTILYRGRVKAILLPAGKDRKQLGPVSEHPAFGIWHDHEEIKEVAAFVRGLRKGRFHAS